MRTPMSWTGLEREEVSQLEKVERANGCSGSALSGSRDSVTKGQAQSRKEQRE